MTGVALATLGAGIINSAGSMYSNNVNAANQAAINNANIAAQMKINDANLQATAINNQTAINLANTAHQREVQDLRDAGLNPILSANGSGAGVPNLSTPNLEAPMSQAAKIENPMGGIASALTSLQASQDQHKISDAQARLLESQLPSTDPIYDNHGNLAGYVDGVRKLQLQANAETANATAQARLSEARAKLETFRANRELAFLSDYGINVHAIPQEKREEYRKLIDQVIFSDIKDRSNVNWRNNVNTMGSAVNSATSVVPNVLVTKKLLGK